MNSAFWVTVLYREPLFERTIDRAGLPYRWTFEVFAPDAASALAEGQRRFAQCVVETSVGWSRDIVGWEVVGATAAMETRSIREEGAR